MSMTGKHRHVNDETLLLYTEGELSPARAAEVGCHLGGCNHCSTRLKEMARTLADFAQAQPQAHDSDLPPADEARVALIARMAEIAASRPNSWFGWVNPVVMPARRAFVLAGAILLVVSIGGVYRQELRSKAGQVSASVALWSEPRSSLTPGTTLPTTAAQLCAAPPEQPAPHVPASLRQKVLAVYGVSDAPADAYEVDYLITPQLGGATDIGNLWPEPYFDTEWNAHVKDQLEDRLYQMVCHGDIDLATAQQDISKDWIAAYRKYFHTENPIDQNFARRL
jgi:anti-sigma factor RsiW